MRAFHARIPACRCRRDSPCRAGRAGQPETDGMTALAGRQMPCHPSAEASALWPRNPVTKWMDGRRKKEGITMAPDRQALADAARGRATAVTAYLDAYAAYEHGLARLAAVSAAVSGILDADYALALETGTALAWHEPRRVR
jgi:hypothetical protein